MRPNSHRRSGKAWAIVNENNPAYVITGWDVCPTADHAKRVRDIRNGTAFPVTKNAKWRVIRVEIKEVK